MHGRRLQRCISPYPFVLLSFPPCPLPSCPFNVPKLTLPGRHRRPDIHSPNWKKPPKRECVPSSQPLFVRLLTGLVFLYLTSIPIVNGISSTPSTYSCAPSLPDTRIIDVKFLTPTLLLALVIKGNAPYLNPHPNHYYLHRPFPLPPPWNFEIRPRKLNEPDNTPSLLALPMSGPLPWTPHTGPEPPPTPLDPSKVSLTPIPCADGFAPVQMDVHDASDARNPLPARVCLLGKDRRTYRVFELEVKE